MSGTDCSRRTQCEMLKDALELVATLADQLSCISRGIDGVTLNGDRTPTETSAFRFETGRRTSVSVADQPDRRQVFRSDPGHLRKIIRARRARDDVFGKDLFADPAWDILLDLAIARAENKQVSVTSLCIASGVPATTAL